MTTGAQISPIPLVEVLLHPDANWDFWFCKLGRLHNPVGDPVFKQIYLWLDSLSRQINGQINTHPEWINITQEMQLHPLAEVSVDMTLEKDTFLIADS